jgi:GrpB-like predicted nucleotidyltransferase (UPF0157 family)
MASDDPLDIIEIQDYDPEWPTMFRAEKGRIRATFGGLAKDIQHVGSTAIPGLASKPIIDILLALEDLTEISAYLVRLKELGYANVPHNEDAERRFFQKGMPRTHHVHVVRSGGWTYWKHLLFRDYLLDHPSTVKEYELLKRTLAERFRDDRSRYVEGKSEFIESVIARAVKKRVLLLSFDQLSFSSIT